MIKINRLSDYAVVLLAQCAHLGGKASTTTVLAEKTHIALPVVRKLMQQLRDADLVKATQGNCGGYALSKPLECIYLLEVLCAIQGPMTLTQCSQGEHACQVQCQHPFEQHWQTIYQAIESLLSPITLADMMAAKPLLLTAHPAAHVSQRENVHGG